MSSANDMRALLRPLGVYDLSAPFNGAELDSAGVVLDRVEERLDEIVREALLITAEDWGLEQIAALMAHRPATEDPRAMGAALAALLRIGGDSFTLSAVNDTIAGCGIPAEVAETGVGTVSVRFPATRGIPGEFDRLRKIIEDILPAHLGVEYSFWFITWGELEARFPLWQELEGLSWNEVQAGA